MPSDKPRKNHYIPEMILKRFCDHKETLWVNNGSKVYKTNIKDTFEKRDLTATRNMIPSTTDHNYTVELSYEHEDEASSGLGVLGRDSAAGGRMTPAGLRHPSHRTGRFLVGEPPQDEVQHLGEAAGQVFLQPVGQLHDRVHEVSWPRLHRIYL